MRGLAILVCALLVLILLAWYLWAPGRHSDLSWLMLTLLFVILFGRELYESLPAEHPSTSHGFAIPVELEPCPEAEVEESDQRPLVEGYWVGDFTLRPLSSTETVDRTIPIRLEFRACGGAWEVEPRLLPVDGEGVSRVEVIEYDDRTGDLDLQITLGPSLNTSVVTANLHYDGVHLRMDPDAEIEGELCRARLVHAQLDHC